MTENYVLDTGPLGQLTHPRPNPKFTVWFQGLLQKSDVRVFIPEICDYELRRNLLLENLHESIKRLDEFEGTLSYLPINTNAIKRAAEFGQTIDESERNSRHRKR